MIGGARTKFGWVAAALGAGLLLRLLFIYRFSHILGDTLVYGDIARNLIEHGVYGFRQAGLDPRPTLIRLPGYPLFLAGCFKVFGMDHYGAVMLTQAAMDLWTCLLLAGIARRMFGERAGMAALWLGALCPFTANYVAAPLTETPTLFCIALAFYGLVRWREAGGGVDRWVAAIGFALAWAVLLRPEQGMLAAVIVPAMAWMGWGRGRWAGLRPVALAAVLTVLPLGPWAARNWHTLHVFQPLAPRYANDPGETTPFGFQRWYRTWAVDFASTDEVYWNYDGALVEIASLPNRAFDSNAQYEATERLLDDYNVNQASSAALDERFAALAAERVKADPIRYYLATPVARVVNMALRPRTEMLPVPLEWWQDGRWTTRLFGWGYAGLNLGYFVLAGVAVWRREWWAAERVIVYAMLAAIVFRVALLLTVDNSEPRYTLEFFPVLIVLAGAALANRVVKGTAAVVPPPIPGERDFSR